ncbi:DsbA family protein [Vibrio natriegens]|uniref:DsbA family protein n=1 Tax=Vibrio natriegens TaxID=691 RepID=UPI000A5E3ACB|nr:DsbA family protein [Vibrio natriegens]
MRLAAPFVLLPLISGCQSEDTDQLKSEIESLRQEVSQLSQEVGDIGGKISEIHDLAFKKPKKEPKILPDQPDFNEGGSLPVLGSSDAKIAIIEFSDFQCPYCKSFADFTFKELKKNFIDTGKVQYVPRDYPLDFHPQAEGAAIAAACSSQQKSYWPMRDMLFSNVKQLGDDFYHKAATDLSLDLQAFSDCLKDPTVAEKVKEDLSLGQSLGVRGTPSFLIGRVENNLLIEPQIVVGAQQYSVFESIINELEKENNKPEE